MSKPRKVSRKARRAVGRRGMIALSLAGVLVVLGVSAMFTGTQLENHNSFCASCHTQDESKYYQQSLSPAVDLASFHEARNAARCIDCHTAAGVFGRVGGLMAGASDLVSYFSGHYPQPAVQDRPIGDGNCLKCHADVAARQDFNNHFHVFLSQWEAADPANAATCVSCHNGHKPNGDVKVGYLVQNDTLAVCQKCHQAAGGG